MEAQEIIHSFTVTVYFPFFHLVSYHNSCIHSYWISPESRYEPALLIIKLYKQQHANVMKGMLWPIKRRFQHRDYMSDDRMNDEREGIWKEGIVAWMM
jgi:hypothetical protein